MSNQININRATHIHLKTSEDYLLDATVSSANVSGSVRTI
jgi:hypothetical protein